VRSHPPFPPRFWLAAEWQPEILHGSRCWCCWVVPASDVRHPWLVVPCKPVMPVASGLRTRDQQHALPHVCHAPPRICHAPPHVCHAAPHVCRWVNVGIAVFGLGVFCLVARGYVETPILDSDEVNSSCGRGS